jgi:chitodextrinase
MRRMLASVAVLAAVLLAPSAALGAVAPNLVGPGSPTATPQIPLSWNDVSPLPGITPITYRVMRAAAGTCPAPFPGTFAQLGPDIVDGFLYSDEPGDGAYCYLVTADDGILPPEPSNQVPVTLDTAAPAITVTPTGGDGCTGPFSFTATATDLTSAALTVDTAPYTPNTVYTPVAPPFTAVSPVVGASDGLGHASSQPVLGVTLDSSPPGGTSLEVTTDPGARKATLGWDPAPNDGAPLDVYRVRTKGPQGPGTINVAGPPVVVQNLQVDATYEFTLDAHDQCGRYGATSVRLVRLNDMTPPSPPIIAGPSFNPATRVVSLSWVASSDNIQVDHYVILRNGVPLGATDATVFADGSPPEHAQLSYVVRAVDTNGNMTDSAAAMTNTPDWTAPSAPLPTITPQGTTVSLRWPPASDNIGVVGYDVLRDNNVRASMTAAVRSYNDVGVPAGVHTWSVRSRDDAGLSATSAPQTFTIKKAVARANVLSTRLAGGGSGAARYALQGQGRLLVDLRVVGTLAKSKLRIYVSSGRGRITLWRGTPASSAPRTRLGSALVRRGYVTIKLNRALHTGRIRLVLLSSNPVVIAATGKHKPAIMTG